MEFVKSLIFVALLAAAAQAADIYDPATCTEFPCLIFEDNFDFLDHSVWEHELNQGGGGNYEFQAYVNNRSISYTRDGIMYIKPQLTPDWQGEDFLYNGTLDLWGMNGINDVCTSNLFEGCKKTGTDTDIISPVLSARLRTDLSFSFKYGRVEVRSQVPRGDWMWPAVWMLPHHHPYGGWPASGEMDIIELRSNDHLGDNDEISNMWAANTMHWGPYIDLNRYASTKTEYQSNLNVSFADAYHVWALEWTDEYIKVFLNDDEVFDLTPNATFYELGQFPDGTHNPWSEGEKMAPFDQPFYLIMNVAIGGTGGYFPDGIASTPAKPWLNSSPQAKLDFWNGRSSWYPSWTQGEDSVSEGASLRIDYIRVYKTDPSQI